MSKRSSTSVIKIVTAITLLAGLFACGGSSPEDEARESSLTPAVTSESSSRSSFPTIDMAIIENTNYEPFNRHVDVHGLRIMVHRLCFNYCGGQ